MSPHPVRDGFTATTRHPAIVLAEIAWRWTFAIAALAILAVAGLRFLGTIHVGRGDLLFARSGQPLFIADAISHIFQEAAPRVVRLGIVVLPALAMLWIAAACAGRLATLKALLANSAGAGIAPLLGLNFLRVALAMTALLSYVGAMIVAGLASASSSDPQKSAGIFLLIFLLFTILIAMAWSAVNWFLTLATIFAVRDGRNTFGAVADAVQLFRRNAADFVAVSSWFGFLRVVLIIVVAVVSVASLAALDKSQVAAAFLLLLVISLGYFAVADYLYIVRLAAYVAIAQGARPPETATAASPPPSLAPETTAAGLPAEA